MAEKLGLLNHFVFGEWGQRDAINRNAETLETVEARLDDLRKLVARQASEIMQLRAMFTGLVHVLRDKPGLDESELARAVEAAWLELCPPPPEPKPAPTDPYRGLPGEPSAASIEAAKALLAKAQDHHFSFRFAEAKAIYQQIVEQHADTKQAAVARQQIANLRDA